MYMALCIAGALMFVISNRYDQANVEEGKFSNRKLAISVITFLIGIALMGLGLEGIKQ